MVSSFLSFFTSRRMVKTRPLLSFPGSLTKSDMFTHLDTETIYTTHLRIKIVKKIFHSSVLLFSSVQGFNGQSLRQNFFPMWNGLDRSERDRHLNVSPPPPFSPPPSPNRKLTNKRTNLEVLYHFRNKIIANGLFHNFDLLRSRCITP